MYIREQLKLDDEIRNRMCTHFFFGAISVYERMKCVAHKIRKGNDIKLCNF